MRRYPADPNALDQGYGANGFRMFMKDESGQTLADYYARIMTFLVNGSMTDEHGQVSMTPPPPGPSITCTLTSAR